MTKWKDQSWQLMIHTSMTAFEVYCLWGETWWDQPLTIWLPDVTQGYYIPSEQPLKLKLLYIVQLAIWAYTAFSHRFLETRRYDYLQMLAHHVLTMALVIGSWSFTYFKIGLLVFYIHDVSDIFIDVLKMSNYVKTEGPKYFFLTEVGYVASMVAWAYWRFYQLISRVIYDTLIETHALLIHDETGGKPWLNPAPSILPWYVTANLMLFGLLLLHIYWYFLLARIGVRMLSQGAHDAGRAEYEGESDHDG